MDQERLIIITGPECSGKSSLTKDLSERLSAPAVYEYAREYLENIRRPYRADDLYEIAREQIKRIQSALAEHPTLVISDTGPEVIEIWHREKFGEPKPELLKLKKLLRPKHYLLCKPDLEWQPDPQRENPYDRDRLFELYRNLLEKDACSYTIISGEKRVEQALQVLKSL
jgi:nicotinamide riboside kinase